METRRQVPNIVMGELRCSRVRLTQIIIIMASRLSLIMAAANWNAAISSNVYILRLKGDSVHQWTAAQRVGTLDSDKYVYAPAKAWST